MEESPWEASSHSASQEILPFMGFEDSILCSQEPANSKALCNIYNKLVINGKEMLAPHPNPKGEGHPLLQLC
jgi:hypothetical protein